MDFSDNFAKSPPDSIKTCKNTVDLASIETRARVRRRKNQLAPSRERQTQALVQRINLHVEGHTAVSVTFP